ncbi:dihydrofolate reductase family protein [Bariatricus sp. SGI.154]|uniref:dihydrofolate reductase family protein n=1 Tax=Bariatricus sp. SGI.154 TaxID=3420549 RepID=UPI003D04A045
MRKVILYIAISLDGYIADKNGKVDWLNEYGSDEDMEGADGYSLFLKKVDTVVMGYNTYHQIVTELSPEQWVYEGLKSYVITHNKIPSNSEIMFVNSSPGDLIKNLKKESGKDIWICGGANIINQLMQEELIDRFHISVIPTILGNGIKLFDEIDNEVKLDFVQTRSGNGIVELVYEHR